MTETKSRPIYNFSKKRKREEGTEEGTGGSLDPPLKNRGRKDDNDSDSEDRDEPKQKRAKTDSDRDEPKRKRAKTEDSDSDNEDRDEPKQKRAKTEDSDDYSYGKTQDGDEFIEKKLGSGKLLTAFAKPRQSSAELMDVVSKAKKRALSKKKKVSPVDEDRDHKIKVTISNPRKKKKQESKKSESTKKSRVKTADEQQKPRKSKTSKKTKAESKKPRKAEESDEDIDMMTPKDIESIICNLQDIPQHASKAKLLGHLSLDTDIDTFETAIEWYMSRPKQSRNDIFTFCKKMLYGMSVDAFK